MPRAFVLVAIIGFGCSPSRAPTLEDSGPAADAGSDAGLSDAGDGGCDIMDPSCPCPTNFHRCNSICQLDENPEFCGDSCMACPEPADSTATCSNGICGLTCINGANLCSGNCVTNSVTNCGENCLVCPTGANADPLCEPNDAGNYECGLSCNNGFSTCSLNGQCTAALGGACGENSDCCGGKCQSTLCCSIPGTPCGVMADCNNNLCNMSAPMQCQSNLCCLPPGTACTANTDCCGADGGTGTCSGVGSLMFCE